ncbi:MAG TPA: IS200/IS605 family transposase [Pyrinomonadaceae bacterium]|nr:IS200/IS605 family transposase [Pyrinomonadaceae bacterium]
MPHTYSHLIFHIVFSTKERRPLIDPELREQLYEYIGGTVRGLGGILIEIGGVADHVHLLVILKPTILLSDFMRMMKSSTSKCANEATAGHFQWQDGYGAFTVGKSQIGAVRNYIRDQEEHHRKVDFRDEFIKMLESSGIDFDPQYLWQ